MKVLTSRVILFAFVSFFVLGAATIAYAETKEEKEVKIAGGERSGSTPAIDYQVVTSKAYVDGEVATKQNNIVATNASYVYDSTNNPTAAGSVVTTTGTAGTVSQRGIATAPTYDSNDALTNGDWIPTMSAVVNQIGTATDALTWDSTIPVAIDTYSTTFDSTSTHTNGNWPYLGENKLVNGTTLANSLALKENKITSKAAVTYQLSSDIDTPLYTLSAITTYTADATNNPNNNLVANKYGILKWADFEEGGWNNSVEEFGDDFIEDWADDVSAALAGADELIPSARLVGNSLMNKQQQLRPKYTLTSSPGDMAPYSGEVVEYGGRGTPTNRYVTAGINAPLTQKSGADNVILYLNGTKTLAQMQTSNFGATGGSAATYQNKINGALVSLELLKDVYSALHTEISNSVPTGTTGYVATYTGTTPGTTTGPVGGQVAIASTATYETQNNVQTLTNGGDIANVTLVETKQKKKQCYSYETGHDQDANYCLLWLLPD